MRESKAKKKILQVADEMFKRVGYANLNVNEIAHEAKVSIGTLYYHFPEGKTSILMEIRGQIADRYEKKFAERLGSERLQETASLDEGVLQHRFGRYRRFRHPNLLMVLRRLYNGFPNLSIDILGL